MTEAFWLNVLVFQVAWSCERTAGDSSPAGCKSSTAGFFTALCVPRVRLKTGTPHAFTSSAGRHLVQVHVVSWLLSPCFWGAESNPDCPEEIELLQSLWLHRCVCCNFRRSLIHVRLVVSQFGCITFFSNGGKISLMRIYKFKFN